MDAIKSVDLDFPNIGLGGGFALWSFRMCASGAANCPICYATFQHFFGSDGLEGLHKVFTLVSDMREHGRRPIDLSSASSPNVSSDEYSILAMYAAAQTGATETCSECLSELLFNTVSPELVQHAQDVGVFLARHGMNVRVPSPASRQVIPKRPTLSIVGGTDYGDSIPSF